MALDVTRSVEECEIDNGYDAQTAVESSVKAMEFMRNGDSAKDWYDLWNEGNFEEAAKIWPEAPLEANYFADRGR